MKKPWKLRNKQDENWVYLSNMVNLGLELRRPFEAQWVLNLAFLAGRQHSFFNMASHSLHNLLALPGQTQHVDNIILPKWKRQVSNLLKAQPQMSVIPNSIQEEDIIAAKLGKKVLQDYYRNKLVAEKLQQIAGWMYSTGNAFLSDSWDSKSGPMGLDGKTGKISYAGDVACSAWGPFELILPLYSGAKVFQELPWVIIRQRKNLEWLRENLKKGDEVLAEDVSSEAFTIENLFLSNMGVSPANKVPSAYLITAYIKPCKDHPRGAFFRAANGIVEPKIDWPFDKFPIVHFKDIDIPNILYGKAHVDYAIPLQVRWNDCINSISEFNKEVAKTKLITPRQSNVEIKPDGHHREIVHYKPVLGHKPEYMSPYSLPPTVEHELTQITISMENLFSQHEVTRGTNKSDIRSGDMVELLLEQDSYGGVPSYAIFERGLEFHFARILLRVQSGYTTERIVKTGQTEDDFEAIVFKGADIRGNRDVKIAPGSSLPDSEFARKARIKENYQLGLLGNPNEPKTRRRVLRMLDESIVDDIYSDYKQDEQLQQWETNLIITKLTMIPINSYDNHIIHVEEIDRYRKSKRYQRVKVEKPEVFEQIDIFLEVHRSQHQMFIQEEMKKQLQLMQIQGGKNA